MTILEQWRQRKAGLQKKSEVSEIHPIVNEAIDSLFENIVEIYGLKSGDIEPMEHQRLAKLQDELVEIIINFINANQPIKGN